LITVLLSATACNKVQEELAKNIPDISLTQASIPVTIPASSSTALQVQWGTVEFDLNQFIKDNASAAPANAFSLVKHIYVTSVTATAPQSPANADANNNFTNLTYSSAVTPVVVFNTTNDYSTATRLGGAGTTPPADPYTLSVPVSNNTDIITHINSSTNRWSYGFAYQLARPTTKDIQVILNVKYNVSFK
jgi:hypothetical protein